MTDIDFGHLRALVIDDDRLARGLVVQILEEIGVVDVEVASDGEAAFRELRSFVPDFILSDLVMEPMDGISFARRLRTHPDSPNPYAPIILLTAHADRTTVLEARDAGVNAFVTKPVSISELRRKITLALKDPRQFIKSEDYVGPDRRHRDLPLAGRRERRKSAD